MVGGVCARIEYRVPVGILILQYVLTSRIPLIDLTVFFPCRLFIDVDVFTRNQLSSFWVVWGLIKRKSPVNGELEPLVRDDNFDVVQNPLHSSLEVSRDFIDKGIVVVLTKTQYQFTVQPFPISQDAVRAFVVHRWPSCV